MSATVLEVRLAARVRQLRRERDRAVATLDARTTEIPRDLIVERERSPFNRCVYCGTPTYGVSCVSHRDLLGLDPHYNQLAVRPRHPAGCVTPTGTLSPDGSAATVGVTEPATANQGPAAPHQQVNERPGPNREEPT